MNKIFTKNETIDMMVIEAKNQLTKCQILDDMYNRMVLSGNAEVRRLQGMNQFQMKNLEKTIDHLENIRENKSV